jgi:hypothetical protein
MEKQNRLLFWVALQCFFFALVKSNLGGKNSSIIFFAPQKKFSKRKMPVAWKSKVENNLSQKL